MSEGVVFPVNPADGKRSSVYGGKQILADSVAQLDPKLAEAIRGEKDWRYQYPGHFVASIQASLRSPAAALQNARDGLAAVHRQFQFVRGGQALSLAEALGQTGQGFRTHVVR
eukprot:CAMPEP_0204364794 /NCGR_PEP_ID=MMETSP0469-20131031/41418_1 /ASSEMBLY_ACC=CAM_ASM_000384 /TAXON_ID=2969 /ORGANISM="Oxyrrhis marina" /LENGTH=112 /DNA_ID=CAMNT_0051353771 /DNA_START=7 /DNA_END=341 /DNA_ORIENTATION=-